MIQEEDDDAIVDNNEIDTNNNLDGDWALSIPRTYRSTELRKWRLAPVVSNKYGHAGEMGKPVFRQDRFASLKKTTERCYRILLLCADLTSAQDNVLIFKLLQKVQAI